LIDTEVLQDPSPHPLYLDFIYDSGTSLLSLEVRDVQATLSVGQAVLWPPVGFAFPAPSFVTLFVTILLLHSDSIRLH